ncbi:MAG: MBL fold metallo-hydrolase [Syntrophales bacterium]|jgi:metallo-beta-lactamase family protein|nr:MBL fold metallo-hydrolase [Syntrophales bacterium]
MRRKVFYALISFVMIPFSTGFAKEKLDNQYPYIQFLGAAQSIGGSAILIDTGKTIFLIDYGLYYDKEDQQNNQAVLDNPEKLNFVLLTHAHIDHSGRLPLLYKNGFKGPVVGIDATKDIAGRMLDMSLGIAESQNTKLFDRINLNQMMDRFETADYGQIVSLSSDVEVRFNDAGHILGSAIIEIWIKRGNQKLKIVAGGDIGGRNVPILRDHAQINDANYVIVESTYGDSAKGQINYRPFENDVKKALVHGGSVLIPAFVLEKTQKVVAILCNMKIRGVIPSGTPIYSDSRTANDITSIYKRYSKYYDSDARNLVAKGQHPLSCEGLLEVSGKDALAAHGYHKPSIYLSSSGMLGHANSPKHLKAMISDPSNLLAIIGWQAPGTPGRKLQEGAKAIEITIEDWINGNFVTETFTMPVLMKIKKYDVFSSHADGCEIMKWLAGFKTVGKVFVIHGERDTTLSLADRITKYLRVPAMAPAKDYMETLSFDAGKVTTKKQKDMCKGMGRDGLQAGYLD